MRRSSVASTFVALALLTVPAWAPATTYVLLNDRALAERASRIVRGRVDAVHAVEGRAALEYRVAVERTLQGVSEETITVRVPGNPAPVHGPALEVWGAPAFTPGERVLLFLTRSGDGSERVVHLAQGAFRVVETAGRPLVVRPLPGAREAAGIRPHATEAERHGWRDLERFEAWLVERPARRADYFVAGGGVHTGGLLSAMAEADAWGRLRWFAFDRGPRSARRVSWKTHSIGQRGLPGAGHREVRAALRAWTRHRGSNVAYVYDGVTDATAGLAEYDRINSVVFDSTMDEPYDCAAGGTLAIGGPWYEEEADGTFRGRRYHRIVGADVEVMRGVECFFETSRDPRRAALELIAHELGHTLGLGHSCGDESSGDCRSRRSDEALMRAYIHDDGRGGRLTAWDRAAICELYPRGRLTGAQCAGR